MELIDKAAIVAEIERQIKEYSKSKKERPDCEYYDGAVDVLEDFRDEFLDTLKTKSVDLEKELKVIDDAFFDLDGVAVKAATSYLTVEDVKGIARHFYELGLKAQKGE